MCPYSHYHIFSTLYYSTSGYRFLFLPLLHLCLHIAILHLHITYLHYLPYSPNILHGIPKKNSERSGSCSFPCSHDRSGITQEYHNLLFLKREYLGPSQQTLSPKVHPYSSTWFSRIQGKHNSNNPRYRHLSLHCICHQIPLFHQEDQTPNYPVFDQ